MLHRVLREHLATFLAQTGEAPGPVLPRFVQRELRRYLDCGILAFGFARVHCANCGKEELVAFSCKGRGFCPSCCGRRMADSAVHLCDEVLPQVPVRQWVLSLPFRIRYLLAYDASLCSAVRRILVRTLLEWLRERAASAGVPGGRSGAVVLAQRFGGALNLNLHFHTLVLDGVFTRPKRFGPPVFHEAAPLTDEDVVAVNTILHRRILRYLQRRGRLPRDEHEEASEPEPDEPLFAQLCAASVQGRVALGAKSGARVQRLGRRREAESDRPLFIPGSLCCDLEQFSLHAKVRIEAQDREGLERLCKYITRPPIKTERLSLAPDGRVIYALRRHWRDGTSAIAFKPLDFIARLAALVPRPRAHLLTYHGILAPAAEWRDLVVPRPRVKSSPCLDPMGPSPRSTDCGAAAEPRGAGAEHSSPEAQGSSTGSALEASAETCSPAKTCSPGSGGELAGESSGTTPAPGQKARHPTRTSWAELMKRVFEIDVLLCPHCGGRRKLIAFLTDGLVVRKILAHLGLPTEPPALAPARAPPEPELGW